MTGRKLWLLVLLPAVFVWWFAAIIEWRGEMTSRQILSGKSQRETAHTFPLSVEPARAAFTRMLVEKSANYEELNSYFEHVLGRRPFYAPYWLDRSKAALYAGDSEAALSYADKAVKLWPTRPALTWKAALQFTRLGNSDRALNALRAVVENAPHNLLPAVAIALRLAPDPETALVRILPGDEVDHGARDKILLRLLRNARNQQQIEFGAVIWSQISFEVKSDKELRRYFVEWMASSGNRDKAVEAWQGYPGTNESNHIYNPGFETSLSGGFDWRVSAMDGVVAEQSEVNPNNGNSSMHIRFSGLENLSYSNVRQYIPVLPGASYRLSFYWAGEDITTRSGPFVTIRAKPGVHFTRTTSKTGTWEWEQMALDFVVPEETKIIELIVARRQTDALDNKISGNLWLDDFSLKEIHPHKTL